MEEYKQINHILQEICGAKEKKIQNISFYVEGLTFQKLQAILVKLGEIYREDITNNYCVAIIPGGFAKKNYAVVMVELKDNKIKIASYADEGIINQHTSEGVLHELKKNIETYIRTNEKE